MTTFTNTWVSFRVIACLFDKNCILPISYDEYKSGFTNLEWNVPDNERGDNSNPDTRGNLKIEVKFAEKVAEAINVVLYGIFDGTVLIFWWRHNCDRL